MEDRMPYKRQILCQIFIKVWREKKRAIPLLQAVAFNKCRYRTVWQVYELHISGLTVPLRSRQPSLFYSLYWKPQPRKNILQRKVPTMIARAQSTEAKHEFCLYSVSQRNLMHLNVRTEDSALWQIEQYKCHPTRKISSSLMQNKSHNIS